MELNSVNLVRAREARLRKAAEDKSLFALAPEDVHRIDAMLVGEWGIDCPETGTTFDAALEAIRDREKAQRLERIMSATAAQLKATREDHLIAEMPIFEAIADAELLGLVSSRRRHVIIDSIATAIGLARYLDIRGHILDAGCHAGFLPIIASEFLPNTFVGIDPASEAIELGQSRLRNPERLSLVRGSIPWQTTRRFEMIVSINACPAATSERGAFVHNISALLDPGGIAVVVSPYWIDADVRQTRNQLKLAKLGFGLGDVMGGWGGMPPTFECDGYLVLVKGSANPFPNHVGTEMESDWNLFRAYANTVGIPARQKTQSFERANRRMSPLEYDGTIHSSSSAVTNERN
jgi:SAM-dependent methyltransferase